MDSNVVPLLFFCVCCIIIVVPFSLLVIYLVMKGRQQAWAGTIISKSANVSTNMDDDSTSMIYSVRIKSDAGKEFNYGVDKTKYEEYKKGDRLKKESGKLWAEKL